MEYESADGTKVDDETAAKRHHARRQRREPGEAVLQLASWLADSAGTGAVGLLQSRNSSSALGLYPLDALAADAGVAADGGGFRGITLSYLARSEERVDAVLTEVKRAGGKIGKPAQRAPRDFGYLSDPDGYLWKAAAGAGDQSFDAEEPAPRRFLGLGSGQQVASVGESRADEIPA